MQGQSPALKVRFNCLPDRSGLCPHGRKGSPAAGAPPLKQARNELCDGWHLSNLNRAFSAPRDCLRVPGALLQAKTEWRHWR